MVVLPGVLPSLCRSNSVNLDMSEFSMYAAHCIDLALHEVVLSQEERPVEWQELGTYSAFVSEQTESAIIPWNYSLVYRRS